MPPPFPTTPLTRLTPPGPNPPPIHALTFSASPGTYLLTGSADRAIRLYNPTTSRLIQTYAAHGHAVHDLAVSADNAVLASVGGDRGVFVWDVSTAVTTRRFAGHAGRVDAVAFGGVGDSVVVSGGFDTRVLVWDLRAKGDGRAVGVLEGARDGVSSVVVRDAEVWAGSVDGGVRVYDLRGGCVDTDVLGGSVGSVCPAGDGGSYLVSTLGSKVRLMDRGSGRALQGFGGEGFRNEEFAVRSTLAMGDENAISGSEDGSVWVWDVLTGKVKERVWHKEGVEGANGLRGKRDVVNTVAWNEAKKQWASAGADGSVVLWGQGD